MDLLPVRRSPSKPSTHTGVNALADLLEKARVHEGAAKVHSSLAWFGIAGGLVLTLAGYIALEVDPAAFTHSGFFIVGRGWIADYLCFLSMLGLPMLVLGLATLVVDLYMLFRPVPTAGHWLCLAEVYGAIGAGTGWGIVALA
ncbi:MAG: hypothetical protein ACYDHO_08275, partial [Gaiellaceae bacterium]